MTIPDAIRPFWARFEAEAGQGVSARFYEAFHFSDNESSAEALAKLVLSGTKRGAASLMWMFEAENRPPPKPGDLSVVTGWRGNPLCVIETTAIEIVPFEEVTEAFAAIEGEGDGSLRYWREGHWAYYGRECRRLGREPDLRMPIACEQFSVVYRA